VPNQGFFLGNYLLSGIDHFELANNIRGEITPQAGQQLAEKSLFLLHEGVLLKEPQNLPPIGPPNAIDSHQLEAQNRFQAEQSTACSTPLLSTSLAPEQNQTSSYYLISDSQSNQLSVLRRRSSKPITHLKLYSIEGKLIAQSQGSSISSEALSPGLYIIQVYHQGENLASLKYWLE
ncbi:MAG: T9SS type A sorting domain-containing protein, partial [Bacteroidota bacterium]